MFDDVWEVRLHFHDRDNLERTMCVSDITFYNLLALIETAGYGSKDYMYYVRDAGLGVAGLEEICDDDKVDEMLDHIANNDQNVVNLTVVRGTNPRPADLNSGVTSRDSCYSNLPLIMPGHHHYALRKTIKNNSTSISNLK